MIDSDQGHRTRPPASVRLGLTARRHDAELSVAGELDLATRHRLDGLLRRLEIGGRPLRLDLRAVTFVDLCGWRVIEDAVDRRRRAGLPGIRVVRTSARVERLTALITQCDGRLVTPGAAAEPAPEASDGAGRI